MDHGESKALVVIVDGVEELEATAPTDLLRRAGVHVTVASASASKLVAGRNNLCLGADVTLGECLGQPWDLVVIPGGPGHEALLDKKEVFALLSAQKAKDGWIGSICAGPLVLQKAGLLEGKRFTSFPATADVLPERVPDEPVVVDGRLVTSQGAGTAILFGLSLVEALCGPEKRREIAASICHPQP